MREKPTTSPSTSAVATCCTGLLTLGSLVTACGASNMASGVADVPADAASSGPEAGREEAATHDADKAPPRSSVRIAHWSPDAPALDVCFALQGSPWAGKTPALANATADAGALGRMTEGGDAGDGGSAGLTFPQVTTYMALAPGTYSMRFVAGGASDCSISVADLGSVVLGADAYTTVAAVGEATPMGADSPLKIVSLVDEVTAPGSEAAIRFINASPSASLTPVDFGTGSISSKGGAFVALVTGIAFGQAGLPSGPDGGAVDANGYLASNPLAGATLSAHPTQNAAADTTTALNDVTVNGGSAATIALVNGVGSGATANGAKLLLCADVDNSAQPLGLASCRMVSTP